MPGHKIDISKGENISTVSQQWANRPDDQRFLTLDALRDQTDLWAAASRNIEVKPKLFKAGVDDGGLIVHIGDDPVLKHDTFVTPSHYGFGQIAALADVPAGYLRALPPEIAAAALNYGFGQQAPDFTRAAYVLDDADGSHLRCITSTKYGRILDRDVVDVVRKMVGDGSGDTHWKVPGVMDWSKMTYNANVDVTKDNTTLYASDRDVFIFLVDDLNPIEVGKLKNGDPDLMFRGFYVWNSEVGARTFGVATMLLRGVCCNRILWGVEHFKQTAFRHTAGAPGKFLTEAAPALESYSQSAQGKLVDGVKAAKAAKVASDDDERVAFLKTLGFSARKAEEIITVHLLEEQTAPESVWDFAQGITAYARQEPHQDARLDIERIAGKLLDKVVA